MEKFAKLYEEPFYLATQCRSSQHAVSFLHSPTLAPMQLPTPASSPLPVKTVEPRVSVLPPSKLMPTHPEPVYLVDGIQRTDSTRHVQTKSRYDSFIPAYEVWYLNHIRQKQKGNSAKKRKFQAEYQYNDIPNEDTSPLVPHNNSTESTFARLNYNLTEYELTDIHMGISQGQDMHTIYNTTLSRHSHLPYNLFCVKYTKIKQDMRRRRYGPWI